MTGYGGRTLHVDLTHRAERGCAPWTSGTARAFLGGNGLAARLLWEAAVPGTDAFDPGNPVALAVGPITDTIVPGNSRACVRHQVAPDGPVLRLDVRRAVPGHAQAHRLRRRGGDRARRPPRLPRRGRRGRDDPRRARRLGKARRGTRWRRSRPRTAPRPTCWPSARPGSTASGFACLAHYWKNREGVAGRGGIGAVWGAKNLKAVTVRGSRKTAVADPGAAQAAGRRDARAHEEGHREPLDVRHALPHRAHQRHRRARRLQPPAGDLRRVGGDRRPLARRSTTTTGTRPASSARSACGKQFAVPADVPVLRRRPRKMPEYETSSPSGRCSATSNAPSIIHANILCDLLGLDSISMGVTLAFVAELSRARAPDAGRRRRTVRVGRSRAGMIRLLEQTARREGFGDRLAEGSWRLAREIGQAAPSACLTR